MGLGCGGWVSAGFGIGEVCSELSAIDCAGRNLACTYCVVFYFPIWDEVLPTLRMWGQRAPPKIGGGRQNDA